MSIEEDSIAGVVLSTLKQRPDIIALLVVVSGFLYYMNIKDEQHIAAQEKERQMIVNAITAKEARENILETQRIQRCHDMQEQSNKAMNNIADALREGAEADARMQQTVSSLVGAVNELRRSNEDLRGVVAGLAAMFEFSRGIVPVDSRLMNIETRNMDLDATR